MRNTESGYDEKVFYDDELRGGGYDPYGGGDSYGGGYDPYGGGDPYGDGGYDPYGGGDPYGDGGRGGDDLYGDDLHGGGGDREYDDMDMLTYAERQSVNRAEENASALLTMDKRLRNPYEYFIDQMDELLNDVMYRELKETAKPEIEDLYLLINKCSFIRNRNPMLFYFGYCINKEPRSLKIIKSILGDSQNEISNCLKYSALLKTLSDPIPAYSNFTRFESDIPVHCWDEGGKHYYMNFADKPKRAEGQCKQVPEKYKELQFTEEYGRIKFMDDYIMRGKLGAGSYGQIFDLFNKECKECDRVVKLIDMAKIEDYAFGRELFMFQLFDDLGLSPRFIKGYIAHVRNFRFGVIEMEKADMTLLSYIKEAELNDTQMKLLYEQLFTILEKMSKHGILHGDFHSANITVDSNGKNMKLLDFSHSYRLMNGMHKKFYMYTDFARFSQTCSEVYNKFTKDNKNPETPLTKNLIKMMEINKEKFGLETLPDELNDKGQKYYGAMYDKHYPKPPNISQAWKVFDGLANPQGETLDWVDRFGKHFVFNNPNWTDKFEEFFMFNNPVSSSYKLENLVFYGITDPMFTSVDNPHIFISLEKYEITVDGGVEKDIIKEFLNSLTGYGHIKKELKRRFHLFDTLIGKESDKSIFYDGFKTLHIKLEEEKLGEAEIKKVDEVNIKGSHKEITCEIGSNILTSYIFEKDEKDRKKGAEYFEKTVMATGVKEQFIHWGFWLRKME
jgi:hypothetical protein